MPAPVLPDTFVMLCDWRGRCIWISDANLPVTVGGFVWEQLATESQQEMKDGLGQVAMQRESRQVEVVDRHRYRYRGWLWPLDSPEMAVCILGIRVPVELSRLTERERATLELLAVGMETRLIAERLKVSVSTIHTHLRRAREKLGLTSVEALISFAARHCYPTHQPLIAEARPISRL